MQCRLLSGCEPRRPDRGELFDARRGRDDTARYAYLPNRSVSTYPCWPPDCDDITVKKFCPLR